MENEKKVEVLEDKQQLLQTYDNEQKKEKNLEFKTLIFAYLCLFVAFLAILPNIYIKNQIYYISRDIGELYEKHAILKEENVDLKRKIEAIQFKNQILDTLSIDE